MALLPQSSSDAVSRGAARAVFPRRSAAFLVEMVVLVAFLAASAAVLTGVFGGAAALGERSDQLSVALTLASTGAENGAESFAADPTAPSPETTYYEQREGSLVQVEQAGEDAFAVTRTVSAQPAEAGVLYRAVIVVSKHGEDVYTLETARYVSERGGV